jgi:hypothetical protein
LSSGLIWDGQWLTQNCIRAKKVYDNHVIGQYGELWHRFRVPAGWIYSHSIQMFGSWREKRPHVMDNFVPDSSER